MNYPRKLVLRKEWVYFCDLCKVRCGTLSVFNSHENGARHRSKLLNGGKCRRGRSCNRLCIGCKFCNIKCFEWGMTYEKHQQSMHHKKAVRLTRSLVKNQTPVKEPKPYINATSPLLPSIKDEEMQTICLRDDSSVIPQPTDGQVHYGPEECSVIPQTTDLQLLSIKVENGQTNSVHEECDVIPQATDVQVCCDPEDCSVIPQTTDVQVCSDPEDCSVIPQTTDVQLLNIKVENVQTNGDPEDCMIIPANKEIIGVQLGVPSNASFNKDSELNSLDESSSLCEKPRKRSWKHVESSSPGRRWCLRTFYSQSATEVQNEVCLSEERFQRTGERFIRTSNVRSRLGPHIRIGNNGHIQNEAQIFALPDVITLD